MTASHVTHAPSDGLRYISWFMVNYYFITLTIVVHLWRCFKHIWSSTVV